LIITNVEGSILCQRQRGFLSSVEPSSAPLLMIKLSFELSCWSGIDRQMDERRTLQILAWTVGGVVGFMFVLNAIALAAL
jgi:hypothetical protein